MGIGAGMTSVEALENTEETGTRSVPQGTNSRKERSSVPGHKPLKMPALRAFVGWTGAFTTPVLSPAFLSSAANRSDFRSSRPVKHPRRVTPFRAQHTAVGTDVRHHALLQHDRTL